MSSDGVMPRPPETGVSVTSDGVPTPERLVPVRERAVLLRALVRRVVLPPARRDVLVLLLLVARAVVRPDDLRPLLRFAVLRRAVLRLAVLRLAVLRRAVLRFAVARLAVLRLAVLRFAVLRVPVERFAAVLRPALDLLRAVAIRSLLVGDVGGNADVCSMRAASADIQQEHHLSYFEMSSTRSPVFASDALRAMSAWATMPTSLPSSSTTGKRRI